MLDVFADAWFEEVLSQASSLQVIEGLSFGFEVVIAEAKGGKVRCHGLLEAGQLIQFGAGKFATSPERDKPDVVIELKASRAEAIISGRLSPLAAYMRGEVKIDGDYELVVDDFARLVDRQRLGEVAAGVARLTQF